MNIFHSYRRILIVASHLALIVLANYLAFWLRFDGNVPSENWAAFVDMLPWLVVIRGLTFIPFRLYQGLWKYTSVSDLRDIVLAVSIGTIAFYGVVHWVFGITVYPRSVFLIDTLLLIFFMGGLRLSRRIIQRFGNDNHGKRLLVYGAGDAGEMIVRDMKFSSVSECQPIGFVDDNQIKVNRRIHGVRVLGTGDNMSRIMEIHKPDAVLIAIPSCDSVTIRRIVQSLQVFAVPIKTLPNFRELQDATVRISQIRNLVIEDLLDRAPVGLDSTPVKALLGGQRVLVTGAGGSIGSELARQIVACHPNELVLLDRYENGLYAVFTELESKAKAFNCAVSAVVGDVTDRSRIQAVMEKFQPTIIFHAAAHKHVSLMEGSPCEAVKNNVMGTRVLAELAAQANVMKFILISTDKAVNPTSVMGCAKRVAELWLGSTFGRNGHMFSSVRFGNVLGSNGSAVPKFLEQIKAGGPVTVTHPDMRRFFMLIPEAVQLVLHAAALARGGEIFLLEMGEQIKVLDVVRNLIRLSGFTDEDIAIQYIGIRNGEKLHEELVGADEVAEPSHLDQIFKIRPAVPSNQVVLEAQVLALEELAHKGDAQGVIAKLCEIVPTYQPSSIHYDSSRGQRKEDERVEVYLH